ncbi:MAG TPA: winged helix-turn-helix domain-containing protein [Candidatus Aquilonibacter sp.]|nr:winged helix-turn-helix domain-containing protein [Candidatus Aquilonibacter sp.]
MGRTGSTKNSILGLIAKKERTLSEISEELSLSPSTVSQHLHELEASTVSQHLHELEADGAIVQIDNPHVRKWKYYKLMDNIDNVSTASTGKNMPNNKTLLYYGGGIVVIAAIALLVLSMQNTGGIALQGYVHVPISLTDPPHVPSGTTALMINYSSVQAHLSNAANSSGWISSNASGSINLLSLLNVSQTIGNVSLPANATINMIRFKITSAVIEINGTMYNVTVPSSQVTARIDSTAIVNGSVGILLDLSPTVATIFTQNSTIFVMVPSLKAVVVPQGNVNLRVGERKNLSANESETLRSSRAMINLTNASFSLNGNTTSFSVTVKNSGNRSVQIRHILIYGNESATITAGIGTAEHGQSNSSNVNASASQQRRPQINERLDGSQGGEGGNHSAVVLDMNSGDANGSVGVNENSSAHSVVSINGSGISGNASTGSESHSGEGSSGNASAQGESHDSLNITAESGHVNESSSAHEGENHMNATAVVRTIEILRTINFVVQGNSSALALPFADSEFDQNGYTLAANSSATFTFNGIMSTGAGNIKITPIAGESYMVVVTGEEGASASLNVTAG